MAEVDRRLGGQGGATGVTAPIGVGADLSDV
jgi:hypothetical protein